jgi:hypothetical protein
VQHVPPISLSCHFKTFSVTLNWWSILMSDEVTGIPWPARSRIFSRRMLYRMCIQPLSWLGNLRITWLVLT